MPEYIDKAELLRDLERKIKADNERRMAVVDSDFIDLVNDATVIEDLVEVVRCKDCKYCTSVSDPIVGAVLVFCEYGLKPTAIEPTHFCSYGERKEQK